MESKCAISCKNIYTSFVQANTPHKTEITLLPGTSSSTQPNSPEIYGHWLIMYLAERGTDAL